MEDATGWWEENLLSTFINFHNRYRVPDTRGLGLYFKVGPFKKNNFALPHNNLVLLILIVTIGSWVVRGVDKVDR